MTLPAPVEEVKREKVTEAAFVSDPDAVFVSQKLTNIKAEAAIIGTVLRDMDAYIEVAHLLQPGDFYDRFHAACWGVFDQIVSGAKVIDYNLTTDALLGLNLSFIPPEAETLARLTNLMGAVPNSLNLQEYVQKVRWCAKRRRILKCAKQTIVDILKNPLYEDDDLLDDAINAAIFEATEQSRDNERSLASQVNDYQHEKQAQRDGEIPPPFPTGIPVLSNLLGGGFWNGYLHILAGLQGKGKTTLYLSSVRVRCKEMLARGEDGVIVVFSLEMTASEIIDALVSMESGIPITLLRNMKQMNPRQFLKFQLATERIAKWALVIVDEFRSLTVSQFKRKCRRIQNKHGRIRMCWIDGLWRMRASAKEGDQLDDKLRHVAVGKILDGLTELISKSKGGFYFPLGLTHQYRESILQKKKARMFPVEEDLAQSAAVRHTPQIILGMFDPRWLGAVNIENTTRVYRLKARGIPNLGDTVAHLHFVNKYARYDDGRIGYAEPEDDEMVAIDHLTDDELEALLTF
jgi:replicative DNA helicase